MLTRNLAAVTLGAFLFSSPLIAAPSPYDGVVTIDNPGGGTIAYAQMQHQSLRSAMGKVLGYVHSHFGVRPQLTRVVKSTDGTMLAAAFSVAGKSGDIAGLAMVVVPQNGPAEGAVLSDNADRFRTTFKSMYARLQSQVGSIHNADGSASPVSSVASSAAPASAPASNSPSGRASPVATAPAAALHQTPFPDGTGTIGLPADWSIVSSHGGDVIAKGPRGEQLQFGQPIAVLDPRNPQSRVLGTGPGGTAPGGFVAIPYGTDGVTTFKSAVAQLSQKQRRAPPSFDFSTVKDISGQNGGKTYFLVGDIDTHDGRTANIWVQISISTPMALGGYELEVSQLAVPKALAGEEAKTIAAIFNSYRPNVGSIIQQGAAEGRLRDQIFNNTMSSIQSSIDASNLQTQGMSDFLRGNTVIRDTVTNGRARVSDDLADGLIQANPGRIESVPLSDYQRGIDY